MLPYIKAIRSALRAFNVVCQLAKNITPTVHLTLFAWSMLELWSKISGH